MLKRIYLNLRAAKLALAGRWMTPGDVAASYDSLAETYQANWLTHLCRTTDRLHAMLPADGVSRVTDLGCGSGYSTKFLAEKYPEAQITAVDISAEMLRIGSRRPPGGGEACDNIHFVQDDMLRHLESLPPHSHNLIFSAWAIGYSIPAKIIAESHRVLRPGGTLAVIVNRLGTMPAVFAAFRKTMRAYPASLEKALWPKFPRTADEIGSYLKRHAFAIKTLEAGVVPITPPAPGERLRWLLGTGVLAGFDSVLRLHEPNETTRFFENEIDAATDGWEHHYIMFVANA